MTLPALVVLAAPLVLAARSAVMPAAQALLPGRAVCHQNHAERARAAMVSDPVSGQATRQGPRYPVARQRDPSFERDVAVIGGCGHRGLPLVTAKPVADIRTIRGRGVQA
jgi:hypothetical protein